MITDSELKDKIRSFVLGSLVQESDLKLSDDASFLEEGIIDSTGVMELAAFLEDTFGFQVEDEEIIPDTFDSVNKLIQYVRAKLANKKPVA